MTKRPTEPADWSSDSEALFRSAKTEYAPRAADRERVRHALAQKLADASGAPAASGDTALAAATRTGTTETALSGLVKIGLAVVVVTVSAFASLSMRDSAKRNEPGPAPSITDGAHAPGPSTIPAGPALAEPAPAPSEALASNQPALVRAARAGRERATVGKGLSVARSPSEPAPTAEPSARATAPGSSDLAATPARVAASANDSSSATESSSASDSAPRPSASPRGPASTPVAARESSVAKDARTLTAPEPLTAPSPVRARAAVSLRPDLPDARAELELVRQIQAALRRAEPAEVLSLCAEHARRWPHGTFEQEREGLRAIASCQSAVSGSDARARTYFTEYPHGPLVPRVREACATQLAPSAAGPSDRPPGKADQP